MPKPARMSGGDDRLNHRAEDVGVDAFPIVVAALEHQKAGSVAQHGDGGLLAEQASVDIGESAHGLGHAAALCRIVGDGHGFEQLTDEGGEVGAVTLGAGFQRVGEEVHVGEQSRVLGKIAEQQARHEEVERVDLLHVVHVVVAADVVVDTRHHLGRFDVGLRLLGISDLFDACQRFEELEVAPQQVDGVAVYVVLLGVAGQDIRAVADHVEPRLLLGDSGVGGQGVECFGQVARLDRAVGKFFLDEQCAAVLGVVAFAVDDALDACIAVAAEDAQQFKTERIAELASDELSECLGSLYVGERCLLCHYSCCVWLRMRSAKASKSCRLRMTYASPL